jgi:hypothetical protein
MAPWRRALDLQARRLRGVEDSLLKKLARPLETGNANR